MGRRQLRAELQACWTVYERAPEDRGKPFRAHELEDAQDVDQRPAPGPDALLPPGAQPARDGALSSMLPRMLIARGYRR